jgi:micrococcal nuclease
LRRLVLFLRATPLRLSATVAVLALVLMGAASAIGGQPGASNDAPMTTPTGSVKVALAARATRTPGASPSATVTATATPTVAASASAEPTVAATAKPASVSKLKPTGPTQVARVVSITDGDTIRVQFGGAEYRVRYIGMDTPETHFGTEWMGPEAAQANADLVAGKQVVLEKDVSETDEFGRLLRYVWLHDDGAWLLVNIELLREGFAQVATYPPDVKYIDPWFLDAQRKARKAGIGLWAGEPEPVAMPAPTTPLGFAGGNCEPSYPDMCIPIGTPDLDCGDISERRFRVLWDVPNPDPHRFDGERDGIGCES